MTSCMSSMRSNQLSYAPLGWGGHPPHQDTWLGRIPPEAAPRFELGMEDLQSSALPLGYAAKGKRVTRLELATSSLGSWHSTN